MNYIYDKNLKEFVSTFGGTDLNTPPENCVWVDSELSVQELNDGYYLDDNDNVQPRNGLTPDIDNPILVLGGVATITIASVEELTFLEAGQSTVVQPVDGIVTYESLGSIFDIDHFVDVVIKGDTSITNTVVLDYRSDFETIDDIDYADWKELRQQRDGKISEVEWVRSRHDDELRQGKVEWTETSLDETEYGTFMSYIQDLRDLPANTVDPKDPTWPTKPAFL